MGTWSVVRLAMARWTLVALLLALGVAPEIQAQTEATPERPAAAKQRDASFSLTFSPLHLLMPVFELDAEVAIGNHVGLAVLGGIGSVSAEDSFGDDHRFTAYEVGGRFVGYPIDPFEGLQLGAEVLWLHVSTEDFDGRIDGQASGIAAGPFIGYKLIAKGGFTFFVEGGVEYAFFRAEATDGIDSDEEEDARWIPLINANIGWSF